VAIPSNKKMNWLIIEDALKDRYGHWLEFVATFRDGLVEFGDKVTVLGPSDVTDDVRRELNVEPILPSSMWRKERKPQSPFGKARAMLLWIIATVSAVRMRLRADPSAEIVFVPTVGIPHLLAWFLLLHLFIPRRRTVVLYFMASPIRPCSNGSGATPDGVGGRLFVLLLRGLSQRSKSGGLILASETEALSNALAKLSGAQFWTLPQPVNVFGRGSSTKEAGGSIVIASYGPARHEKGSDVLVKAIEVILKRCLRADVMFVIQWLDDFTLPNGDVARIPDSLASDPRFNRISSLFTAGQYPEWLEKTDLMVLPYRSEYTLRGSRVIVEAMIHGIPVVASEGTTLEDHALCFGAYVVCDANSVEAVASAIEEAITRLPELQKSAKQSGKPYMADWVRDRLGLEPTGYGQS
jgi:glycosyltransferase involved in cell wall biosynthesis